MTKISLSIGVMLITAISSLAAAEHPELKAFPGATDGMVRHVIVLPDKDRSEEGNYKLELVPGKEELTDGVNRVRLDARLVSKSLEGWGYTYYEVSGSGNTISTLMATPEGGEKVKAFVPGDSLEIRYNSRLPVVIYSLKGYQIRYRIWSAPDSFEIAEEG